MSTTSSSIGTAVVLAGGVLVLTAVLGFSVLIAPGHALHSPDIRAMSPQERVPQTMSYLAQSLVISLVDMVIVYGMLRLIGRFLTPLSKRLAAISAVTCGTFVFGAAVLGRVFFLQA